MEHLHLQHVHIPGYTVIRPLGTGGMAQVVLARHELLAQDVAIKLIPTHLDEEMIGRFLQEARVITRLQHPNIIRIFDVGRTERLLFITMDYMQGGNLEEELSTLSRIEPDRALAIATDLALGLHHAHTQGVIHRDVKPANVLFDQHKQRVVLSDFGAARDQWNDMGYTHIGNTVGSPGYMSPEQCRGQRLDGRSDLYCLGNLLFFMLSGQTPYRGPDAVSIALAHVRNPPPALPSPLNKFQALIDQAMAKNPEARFQNGADFAASLTKYRAQWQVTTKSSAPDTTRILNNAQKMEYSAQETILGHWYNRKSQLNIQFWAENIPEFQKLLGQSLNDLRQWMDHRNRKAQHLRLHIQAHPWIHLRIQEILKAARQENTPFGAYIRMNRHIEMILEDDRGISQTLSFPST